jgi:hypothetical protein
MLRPSLKTMLLSIPVLGLLPLASANEVEARAMKYTNHGAYTAQFYVRYNLENGTKCRVRPKGIGTANLYNGGSVTYQLADKMLVFDGGDSCLTENAEIPEGRQVWGRVEISNRTKESCKKDKKVIYRLKGGVVKYTSKGTTLNNNQLSGSALAIADRTIRLSVATRSKWMLA